MKIRNNAQVMGTTMSHEVLAQTIMRNTTELDGIRLGSIPVQLLKVDHRYQRPVNSAHVNKISKDFNKKYLNCIIVSYRDGYFWILDGQHRYNAAVIKGVETLTCIIITDLTSQEEAKMFKDLNINHKKPDPYKLFKANVWNGDKSDPEVAVDLEIKRICDKYNIEVKKVGNGTKGKNLRCLSRVRWIVGSTSYDGATCFEWIIDLLNMTNWADVSNTYIREVILMLKNLWVDNHENANFADLEKKLIEVLNSTTPSMMMNKARHDYPKYAIEPAMTLCLKDMIEN